MTEAQQLLNHPRRHGLFALLLALGLHIVVIDSYKHIALSQAIVQKTRLSSTDTNAVLVGLVHRIPVSPQHTVATVEKSPSPVAKAAQVLPTANPRKSAEVKPVTKTRAVKQDATPVQQKDTIDTAISTPATTALGEKQQQRYRDQVAQILAQNKRYPSRARRRKIEGTNVLRFTLRRDGSLVQSHLLESSRSAALDQATLAMLQRSLPLPPFPDNITEATLNFTIPVAYRLRP